ncbi:uncharacterized protein LOC107207218 [Parus major]|uniref:uncharacterized protein LOC107207218 n=1 Tax=Parus major TaxID=9157 RepID=UPI0008F4C3A8|nr:uncharacterized protein LOC107207218 [Parus major]
MSRNLQSKCRERHRLALRALLVLIEDSSMAERLWSLTESLVELLQDTDGETVAMTLTSLSFIVFDKDMLIPSPTILQLLEVLLRLFDHDNSHVQLISMILFQEMQDFLVEEGKKPFKMHVRQSLLPLFFHCHDENQQVAEASQRALLSMAKLLKRRELANPVKSKQLWKFAEVLVRMAWKAQPQPGEAPCPRRSVYGAGSWAPARCRSWGRGWEVGSKAGHNSDSEKYQIVPGMRKLVWKQAQRN